MTVTIGIKTVHTWNESSVVIFVEISCVHKMMKVLFVDNLITRQDKLLVIKLSTKRTIILCNGLCYAFVSC